MGFDFTWILFPLNIMEQIDRISPIFIYAYNSLVGVITRHFLQICNRVMALDLPPNLVSTQYLENKKAEFHQILYMH